MTNYKASAPYLKECLRTHKERTGEKQIPLSKRLGLFSQGALSQAANQTETNGNASLGIPAATVLFNDIGGDLYKYLPGLEKPKSAKDIKNHIEAVFYVMALSSPHPKVEHRISIPDMYKIGFTQDPDNRCDQLDKTHPEYRHNTIHKYRCKSLVIAKAIEVSVLDKFKKVRNGEYICAFEAEIICQITKASGIWDEDRVQKQEL